MPAMYSVIYVILLNRQGNHDDRPTLPILPYGYGYEQLSRPFQAKLFCQRRNCQSYMRRKNFHDTGIKILAARKGSKGQSVMLSTITTSDFKRGNQAIYFRWLALNIIEIWESLGL